MGKTYTGIGRSTFVIDKQGTLIEVNYKVKANPHFSPPFYCDDVMPHPACIWLGQVMLELVQGLT